MPPKIAIHPPRPKALPPEQLLPFCDCICTWEADSRNLFIQERSAFCPSLACSYVKNEQLFAAMFEILHYLAIVPLVSRDVNVFVTLRVPDSVNLLSHRRFFLAEMINNTSDPLIRWPQGQYKLATWKFPIQFLVKNRPGIVLKGIKPVRELECHFVHLFSDIRIINPVRPCNAIPQIAQRLGE